jgi:hypothetical protein
MWESFVEEVFPVVVVKCTFEKSFIANVAKAGTTNASKLASVPATCKVLVNTGLKTKNLNLKEFSLGVLLHFVRQQSAHFFGVENEVALNLGIVLAETMESKKPRLTKVTVPILKEIEKKGVDLSHYLTNSFVFA